MDNPTLDVIHEKYLTCLRTFAKKHFPNQPNRVEELLVRLPEVLNYYYSATFLKSAIRLRQKSTRFPRIIKYADFAYKNYKTTTSRLSSGANFESCLEIH